MARATTSRAACRQIPRATTRRARSGSTPHRASSATPASEPVHFVEGGVAGAARAHDAVLGVAEPADDRGGVEVAVRDEHGAIDEGPRHVLRGPAPHRERDRRRARLRRRRAVERDAVDRAQPGPQRLHEALAPLVERRHRRREAGPAVRALRQRGEEVHGRGRADDALVVLRPRLEPVRRVLGGRLQLGQVELLEQGLASPEDAHVGPVELVGRAGEEVGAERGHVHERVRGVVDGVHEDERSRGVREVRGAPHVALRAEGVRGRADGEEARLLSERAGEAVHVQLARLGAEAHGLHDEAPLLRQLAPGVDVGVVVELGDDDLVARASTAAPARGRGGR